METRSIETEFFNWLSSQVSPTQLSNLYPVFSDIEKFCVSRKILKKALFQTTDLITLSKVRDTVERDKIFAFTYKKQRKTMSQGIYQYIRFIKDVLQNDQNKPEKAVQSVESEIVDEAEPPKRKVIIDLINDKGIKYIDNRSKQGCLWIVGGLELSPFVEACKKQGVVFHFKEEGYHALGNTPVWWTKDELGTSVDHQPTDDTAQAKSNRREFISWMSEKGINGGAQIVHLSFIKQCGDYANKEQYLNKDIFTEVSASELQRVYDWLTCDATFAEINSKNQNHLIESLGLFIDYASARSVTERISESIVTEEGCDEVSSLLKEQLFIPLKNELERQGIHTIKELQNIKLWQFMNRYNLYSIATRQTVLEKVNAILAQTSTERNSDSFKIFVGEAEFCGPSFTDAYLAFCEYLAQKYPLRIRSLIGKKNPQTDTIAIYKTDDGGMYLKLTNPTAYIQTGLSQETVIQNVTWLFTSCSGVSPLVRLEKLVVEAPEIPDSSANTIITQPVEVVEQEEDNSQNNNSSDLPIEEVEQPQSSALSEYEKKMIGQVENTVLAADLEGISYDDLHDELDITVVAAKRYTALSDSIIEIKTKLYHKEAIIDWDEGADALDVILEKLMQKNNGYVSSAQLYDYARVDMNMFLNDNDMNDERAVFDMAQYLFTKERYHGKRYYFMGKLHISKTSEIINSNFDVFCKYASDQGGVFQFADLVEYLNGIGIKAGNLRAQLKLYTEPCFFYIEEGELISATSMQIDKAWKQTVKKALDKLFDDVDDHIILRDIQQIWFDQLPSLPRGRAWTPLLLQSILRFWGKEFNSRTIMAMGSQSMDTLHTMLVRGDSPIQNFGDAILSYILENGIEKRSFDAEELRSLLVESRMIRGNELLNNMSKALSGDERFAWDVGGNNVNIRV